MRKHLIAAAIVIGAIVWSTALIAGPGLGISKTAPISGTGSSGDPLKLDVCDSGSAYVSNGTSWECGTTGSTYTAGDGLSLTGSDFDINLGGGLSIVADSLRVDIAGASCAGGEAVTAIDSTGTGTCTAVGGSVTAGTNIDVSGSTVSVEPSVTLAGESNIDTLEVFNAATAQTANVRGVDTQMTGTYDATVVTATYAGYFSNTMTVTDPENPLGGITNYGIYATADAVDGASLGNWYAGYFDGPLRVVNGTGTFDSALTSNGTTSLGDSSADALNVLATAGFYADTSFTRAIGTTFSALSTTPGIRIADSTDQAAGVGGGILFTGEPTTGSSSQGDAAAIKAFKTNSTTGNTAFDLAFATRPNGGSLTEAMRITSAQGVETYANTTIGDASADTLTVNATTTHAAPTTVQDFRGTQIDVASVTGALTDWNPTGLSTATTIRAATTGSTDLVSMAGGSTDRKIQITNAGNSVIRVFHEYTTGTTAAMRFTFNQNFVYIKPTESMLFSYDATSSRWRQASGQHQVDAFYVVGALTVDGNTAIGGNPTLGNGASDVTSFNSIIKDTSTVPTVSSCGSSPGTPVGGSNRWRVVAGTGGITACTFTFASDKGARSICVAQINNAGEGVYISAESDTAVTVTAKTGTTDISGDTITVDCQGNG